MDQHATILLIEDHPNILLVERICLEANGYRVITAEDGIRGLELAINERPDLILLDLLIPKMDGYLVLEALKSNPQLRPIPVLVTSAKAQHEEVQKATAYGICGYLVKPFNPQVLLLKVQEIIDDKER